MKQGVLPIQYEQEKSSKGMTSLSGLVTYLELMHAAGLRSSIERHVGLRGGGQGWTDSQVVNSLILLNLAGGESVSDLDVLEKDAGFYTLYFVRSRATGRQMRRTQSHQERRALENRTAWRNVQRRRYSVPSESGRRCSGTWRGSTTRTRRQFSRQAHRAFIPACSQPSA